MEGSGRSMWFPPPRLRRRLSPAVKPAAKAASLYFVCSAPAVRGDGRVPASDKAQGRRSDFASRLKMRRFGLKTSGSEMWQLGAERQGGRVVAIDPREIKGTPPDAISVNITDTGAANRTGGQCHRF